MIDPIADMISRLKNAARVGKAEVRIPLSQIKFAIAKILVQEGYLEEALEDKKAPQPTLLLKLRYYEGRRNVIRGLRRASRSGGRRYVSTRKIAPVANGFGTLILSTPQGVLTGHDAKRKGVGGEALLTVW